MNRISRVQQRTSSTCSACLFPARVVRAEEVGAIFARCSILNFLFGFKIRPRPGGWADRVRTAEYRA